VEKIQAEFRKLLKKQGDVSGAVYYSEIKTIINEVYEKFVYLPSEEGFLHIIGLINSSILQNKWQQYSTKQADNVEKALSICLKNSEITMKDIVSITKRITDLGIDTIPIEIELPDEAEHQVEID